MSLTAEQRKVIIQSLKQHGTLVMAAKTAVVSVDTIRTERKRSPFFDKQIIQALDTGRSSVGDNALTVVESIAFGKDAPTQQRLTAALSLCNAFIPGFKGVTRTDGRIDHIVRVVTAIPRPQYGQIIEGEAKLLPPVDAKRFAKAAYMRDFRKGIRRRADAAPVAAQSTT